MKTRAPSRHSLDRFADRLADAMPRFTQIVLREERNFLAAGLVTVPQLWALLHLDAGGACTMTSMARALRLTPPTATSLVDRLVALRLVQRRPLPGDRRVIRLEMTPRGRRLLSEFHADRRKSARRYFAAVSERERNTFLAVLEKLVNEATSAESVRPRGAEKTRRSS
ncbi:MAG: MarR family transcriptional regulator [Verrucomicrobia bacterium]|nr:MarR family transcriptional regulator [Verrucomicrobiota bacterium]